MRWRWKWIGLVIGLILVCLISVSACEGIQYWVHGPSSNQTVGTYGIDENEQENKLVLEPYAKEVKGKLTSPLYQTSTVDTIVEIAGYIEKYKELRTSFMWVEMNYQGEQEEDLPSAFHYYIPIYEGDFREKVRLFSGKGAYQITIHVPSMEEDEYYYPFAKINITNTNPKIERDLSYSLKARQEGLQISSPLEGYQMIHDSLELTGKVTNDKIKKLLVQQKKGSEQWQQVISVKNGKFEEKIPLLFGEGIHEVQVMLPDLTREGYYLEGSTFFASNTSLKKRTPITYSRLYQERGIELTHPIAGGDEADLTYRIAGKIDASAPYAKETNHLIVQTKKGKEKATYFIPVEKYRFDSDIWLRFGSGEYEVTIFVPEVTKEKRDFFRFYTVATFQVKSQAQKDLRNFLPSRGIQSDHATIKNIAQEVTAGKKTDRDRAYAIYRYVATTLRYDMDKYRRNSFEWDDSALKSIRTQSGVCQDFSFLAIAMFRSLDMPARFVEGHAGGQRHAWVEVWMDGRWVTMDPTWGAGYITPDGRFIQKYDKQYFDPSPASFAKTHRRTGVVY
ncbi:transglutaminase-like domain-containing protein [Hazenella coriacea]|uniref:Transglutaminase superfamily protein n=1 Tax=Hazenella coriacea TaxID=1179467 RepID=A0A4R3L8J7_9BACL|nr:transglutaminase-like domain-containing protein [Hazenella coriacea]TCS95902.1 transglutaminase superfamily protein [Hazenella coriacea]